MDPSHILKRPQARETEEDLLKQQEEFLRSQNKVPKVDVKEEICVTSGTASSVVINDVIERRSGSSSISKHVPKSFDGFPQVFKIKNAISSGSKKSIFALHMEKKKNLKEGLQPVVESSSSNTKLRTFPDSIVDMDSVRIHEENVQKLSNMSEAEILNEQKLLLESLDKNLVQFLKNRREQMHSKQDDHKVTNKMETELINARVKSEVMDVDEVMETEEKELNKINVNVVPVENELDKWLNIGILEREKLEWVGDIPDSKTLEPDKPYSARFDFKGNLLPFTSEIDVRSALYHHGDEPERPGYTIQELYQLSRSNVIQQRILAINTISNIINKCKLGYYDSCFDGSLFQTVIDNDIFLLLRFSVDENIESVILATINCLHTVIVDHVDEVCLDKCLGIIGGFKQPIFCVRKVSEEDKEIKDHVLLGEDFIRGVIRTDLITRLHYVLTTYNSSKETVKQILEVLIRICRHSKESCESVVSTSNLLNYLFVNFITCSSPLPEALKLYRIILAYPDFSAIIFSHNNFMDRIISFIEIEENITGLSKTDLYQIKLESVSLWQCLIHYGTTVELLNSYLVNIIRLLNFYFEKVDFNDHHTNFDFEFFSVLLSLLSSGFEQNITMTHTLPLINNICVKWINQLLSNKYYNFQAVKALGQIFNFFCVYLKQTEVQLSDVKYLSQTNSLINLFLQSEVFSTMCQNMLKHSCIMSSSLFNLKRNPKNLPSLNCMYYNADDYIGIIQEKSSAPFLIPFLKFLNFFYEINHETLPNLELLVHNKYFRKYVSEICSSDSCMSHWFFKFEILLLTNYLWSTYHVNNFNLKLSMKLLNLVQDGERYLVPVIFDMLFSEKVWVTSDKNELFSGCLKTMKTISDTFNGVYKFEVDRSLVSLSSTNSFLPVDWIYSPIIYFNNKNEENTDAIISTLKFCYLVNVFDLWQPFISPASKYCRLTSIYLADSNSVSNHTLQTYLLEEFKLLIKSKQLDFSQDILGISSFYNFYADLLTQFSAMSYGNTLFCMFVLLPIQNKFDVSLRKLIWSEYLYVLKVVRISEIEKVYGMNLKDFIEPVESDFSLLSCYLGNIASSTIDKKRNPLVYDIAFCNLKNYIKLYELKDSEPYKIILGRVNSLKNSELKQALLC